MAIAKSDAQVVSLITQADGTVVAKVNIKLFEQDKIDTRSVVEVIVSNATFAEKSAVSSVWHKAAVLAVS